MTTCIERLKYYFSENGVKYEVLEHRDAFTTQEVAAVVHEKGAHVAKVVIGWADGKLIMLVLPAPALVDFERVRELAGAQHARAAREEEFGYIFRDCDLGAMPPFGKLYDLPTFIHPPLTEEAALVFQAGSHRQTMKIDMADYLRLAAPKVADFTAHSEHAGSA